MRERELLYTVNITTHHTTNHTMFHEIFNFLESTSPRITHNIVNYRSASYVCEPVGRTVEPAKVDPWTHG